MELVNSQPLCSPMSLPASHHYGLHGGGNAFGGADDQPLCSPLPIALPIATPSSPPRQYSLHGTSSAFSSVAGADEDWTKISDLAQRRRIQNRIAQRNYRRKLKRRLADLQRRASVDGTPEPAPEVIKVSPSRPYRVNRKRRLASSTEAKPFCLSTQSYSHYQPTHGSHQSSQRSYQLSDPYADHQSQQPPLLPDAHDDGILFSSSHPYDDRLERADSPPMFEYSPYSGPDEVLLTPGHYQSSSQSPPYSEHHHPQQLSASRPESTYSSYLSGPGSLQQGSLSVSPSVSSSVSDSLPTIKRDPYATSDECFNPYTGYGFMLSIDVGPSASYGYQSNSSTANVSPVRSQPLLLSPMERSA